MPTVQASTSSRDWVSSGVRAPALLEISSDQAAWVAVAETANDLAGIQGHALGSPDRCMIIEGSGLIFLRNDGSVAAAVVNITPLATTETASLARVTANGAVAAGARSVSLSNTGAADATVAGATLKPGETVSFAARNQNTLGAIAYTAAGTELVIGKTV
jgi:hypothetical protein